MAYRLFQNSDKTQPITEAGVSVGYSERKQGTVDALQATTLSKPLLGRWPKSGVRNLANYSQSVSNPTFWPALRNQNGLVITKTGYGVDQTDGVPFSDYTIVGVATSTFTNVFYASDGSILPAVPGNEFNARADVRIIGGSVLSNHRFSVTIVNMDASGSYISQKSSGVIPTVGWQQAFSTSVIPEGVGRVRCAMVFNVQVGDSVDVSIRIKGLQFGRGLIAQPLQFNYGPNDITEPGVEDEWFLYNDGNDSLNTQPLQSGDFSITSVDIYGNMDNKPSSGGSINSLVKERQRDVIVRSPPLIPSELEQVQAYWKAKGYKTEWSPLLLMSTQTDGHWSRGYNPNID